MIIDKSYLYNCHFNIFNHTKYEEKYDKKIFCYGYEIYKILNFWLNKYDIISLYYNSNNIIIKYKKNGNRLSLLINIGE